MQRVGRRHRGRAIVDHQVTGNPAEGGPARFQPGNDVLQALAESGPGEAVPEVAQHHDQRPHSAAASSVGAVDQPQAAEVHLRHIARRVASIRTVALVRLRQLRQATKRWREAYDTRQSRSASNSWMGVSCTRSPVSHRWIWSAQGTSLSSLGVSCRRGPGWPMAARRLSWSSLGAGPPKDMPSPSAAAMYFPMDTLSLQAELSVSISAWFN